MSNLATVQIQRVQGEPEKHQVDRGIVLDFIRRMIKAERLDFVDLRDGTVMVVDDTGMLDGKPTNNKGTQLYRGICRPGTLHHIHGDVAILKRSELE